MASFKKELFCSKPQKNQSLQRKLNAKRIAKKRPKPEGGFVEQSFSLLALRALRNTSF